MATVDDILAGLNEQQKKAVQAIDGKYLVLAGAGSGKTRVLTKRIEYLLHIGVKPWEIVGISFTKKAANEIRERLMSMVGEVALDLNLGTFHSLCMRILLQNQKALGMENLTVIDEDEADKIISEIALTYGYASKEGVAEIRRFLDNWSNNGYSPQEISDKNEYPEDIVNIYSEYRSFKRSVGYIDFNDILILTKELFDIRPDILEKYSRKYRYVSIDEHQDSNRLQMQILDQLTSYHGNLISFADDFQTIYGFRGGDVQNILSVGHNKEEVETILLERNYRSTRNIVEASNAVIANNKAQLEKVSFSENPEGSPIFVYDAADESREADYVVTVIEGLVKTGNYKYSDFMVLYRTHSVSRTLEFSLARAGVPYDVIGGTEFYEREEIKTMVCYLRALDNKLDDLAFERIINKPKRGIGDTTIARIKMYAAEANISFFKALEFIEDIPKINKPTKKRINDFVELIKDGQKFSRKENVTVQSIVLYILQKTQLLEQYNKDKSSDLVRLQNIEELWHISRQFDIREKAELEEGQTILNQFLTETALYVPPEEEDVRDKVSLLTGHGSKGMESRVVFIIGAESGSFPYYKADTEEEREEERRLFYVAMTRAKEMLFISYSKKKYQHGKVFNLYPSPYIAEIPERYKKYLGEANRNR